MLKNFTGFAEEGRSGIGAFSNPMLALLTVFAFVTLYAASSAQAASFSREHRKALSSECERRTGQSTGAKFRRCLTNTKRSLLSERRLTDLTGISNTSRKIIKRNCIGSIPSGLRSYDNCLNSQLAGRPLPKPQEPSKLSETIRILVMVKDCNGEASRKSDPIVSMSLHFQDNLTNMGYRVFGDKHGDLDDFQGGIGCRDQNKIMDMAYRMSRPIDVVAILSVKESVNDSTIMNVIAIDRLSGAFVGQAQEDSRRHQNSRTVREQLSRLAKSASLKLATSISKWQNKRLAGVSFMLKGFDPEIQQDFIERLNESLDGNSKMIEGGNTYFRFFFETGHSRMQIRKTVTRIVGEMNVRILPQSTERDFIITRIGQK